ncbi:MAG: Na+/H+ antiporter NhaA [Gemmatimonadota bacterium]|nr:Na+/H+ antiporter NhaA [Gemmatimonadota bacterium]MDH5803822.1 Na+/H+ antiporter NhaA [Gemmatimonadota bacterium]
MNQADNGHDSPPPESWEPARNLALKLVQPIERFMHVEASSGLVLLGVAFVALVWANSPWGESYEHLWHTPITVGFSKFVFERSLHFWINDFLMAIFFLVVGLEIKREIVEGALSEWRRAAFPVAAAIGGMLVPALIYAAFNYQGAAAGGWGVPMATDIAFAVGIFALLGKRAPPTLRILLLAIAIIDDIGAILVIAIFYSSGIQFAAATYILIGIIAIFALNRLGVRPGLIFVPPALLIWASMYKFGVHPTIAGVIVGLMMPVKPWYGKEGFLVAARKALDEFQRVSEKPNHDDHDLIQPLDRLRKARQEAISPAKRLEAALHPWVAFGIMPLFALANAGVHLGGLNFSSAGSMTAMIGIILGLVVGKPLGIFLASWLSVKLKICALPDCVTWSGIWVTGITAGIGFTMAIFISELAFAGSDELRAVGKLAVLIGTVIAGVGAYLLGRTVLSADQSEVLANVSASEIEGETKYWTS